ncbi:TetR family transcriptional regulator [Brachybacterium sp. P6-10-X1]|uniref:TetR/AcrR family transcriptional regulator n=1 Tax=Brachybacterium sp. P6-10-X1 TaxID=1903186 RepID=UPI000971AF05|nr:TetR/AcrR family transcriptional regulator [Brachybacterium sp. P6-10-X1]APX33442.1 TetR family transcriptional regulator [Brachybacterium sp. P6-10-X1]
MAPDPSPRPAHRPSARMAMLDAAESHLGVDGTLTLDSAARAAGVTKTGLMYHFATKEALLRAVLDHIADRYEREVLAQIEAVHGTGVQDLAAVPAHRRFLAYLDWACHARLSPADLVIFADPKLRVSLTARWQEQLAGWLSIPAGTPVVTRQRLLAVRLMADGLWFDRATGQLELPAEDARSVHALALGLLGGEA